MSDYLILPRNVFGQLKCCNASGVSDPVPAPIAPGRNYVAENLGNPLLWKLAGAMETNGAVGFGVCCGTREFSVEYSFFIQLSNYVDGIFGAGMAVSSNLHDSFFIIVTLEKDELLGGYELFVSINGVGGHTNIPTPVDFYHTVTLGGSLTATPCSGVAIFNGSISNQTTPPLILPANITAQFSIV